MAIEWYPGHMGKSHKEISELIGKSDVIIEVLDARLPDSSSNHRSRRNRPPRLGCLVAGGGIDTQRAGEAFLRELRAGKIGRVSFEEPGPDTVEATGVGDMAGEHTELCEVRRDMEGGNENLD